jgi:hypothetical protein
VECAQLHKAWAAKARCALGTILPLLAPALKSKCIQSSPRCCSSAAELPSCTVWISRYSSLCACVRLTQIGWLGSRRLLLAAVAFHHDVACTKALPSASLCRNSTWHGSTNKLT